MRPKIQQIKTRFASFLTIVILACAVAALFAACGSESGGKSLNPFRPAPPSLSYADGVISVIPQDGCEYKLGDGEWQDEPFFEAAPWLEYAIFIRFKETDTMYYGAERQGTIFAAEMDGRGTAASPYLVRNADDLRNVTRLPDISHIRLTADIDLGGAHWVPISTKGAFAGTFTGAGHTISNLCMEGSGAVGLFGEADGAIFRDLTLDGVEITLNSGTAGALIGEGKAVTLSNIVAINVTANISGAAIVGGIAGRLVALNAVSDVTAQLTATLTGTTGTKSIGGMFGELIGISGVPDEVNGGVGSLFVYFEGFCGVFNAGGIAGFAQNLIMSETISGLTIIQPMPATTLGEARSGGAFGWTDNVAAEDFSATLVVGMVATRVRAGGIAGVSVDSHFKNSQVSLYAEITVAAPSVDEESDFLVGGAVGEAFRELRLTYINAFVDLETAAFAHTFAVGGLVGRANSLTISYAAVDLMMQMKNQDALLAGGFVGAARYLTISNALCTGTMTAEGMLTGTPIFAGGLTGDLGAWQSGNVACALAAEFTVSALVIELSKGSIYRGGVCGLLSGSVTEFELGATVYFDGGLNPAFVADVGFGGLVTAVSVKNALFMSDPANYMDFPNEWSTIDGYPSLNF